jgi:glycosyltransferase involved in cell wall biosynthesis
MAVISTWAVVPTKNRPDLVRQLLASLVGQVQGAVVVDNNDVHDPIVVAGIPAILNLHQPGFPPNLSELLNIGIDAVDTESAPSEWNVALLNDDVICPPGWVESLSDAMRATTAVMAYTDRMGRVEPVLYTTPAPEQSHAATVWACLLRGERHIRLDESMRWWYSDNDLDNMCRRIGGVLAVPGRIPAHLHPSEQTVSSVELSRQAHLDEVTFNDKWRDVVW